MKRIFQITAIVLFVSALWLPLLCTPWKCGQEREALKKRERRDPAGTLDFNNRGRDLRAWVSNVQYWYRDSIAFRRDLLSLYNGTHYLLHNYPEGIFGKDGHLFRRKYMAGKLKPLSQKRQDQIRRNLSRLRRVCDQTQTPCLLVLIPSKATVHPSLAPRWLRERSTDSVRRRLVNMMGENGFPALDLAPALIAQAKMHGKIYFRKYDFHWNVSGALVGYYEMMAAVRELMPGARTVPEDSYVLELQERNTKFSRMLYLERLCSEHLFYIKQANLDPVTIVKNEDVNYQRVLRTISRGGRADVYCPAAKTGTVVFIRDSFLTVPSLLLNHGFSHVVYLNNSEVGRAPERIIEDIHPDLLVIALEETMMVDYFSEIME